MALEPPPARPRLNTEQEQLLWQGLYFPFLFLSSQWRDGSKETRGRQGDKGGGTRENESGRRKQNRRRCGETDKTERGKEPNREVVAKKRSLLCYLKRKAPGER